MVASYFFYGWWDWRFLILIAISTVVDYFVALAISKTDHQATRKRYLLISVCTNLGILGFFKYFNFFADSLVVAAGTLGITLSYPTLNIVLPVGISFYTFQTMAYTIDVYRGRSLPTRDFLLFGVYVAYFPQLVAGPIERPENLLPQFAKPRRITGEMLSSGALLFLIGLVRKVAIADFVAPHVDYAFANAGTIGSFQMAMGVLLFAIQIYGDFSGYSDMARGLSRMMDVELMENFNHPYFSANITEFWRRWHISLSSWLRDYLYIPLGGNRGPAWFVYRNLLLTMLLGGLWHGAAWTFVVWGGLHGAALAIHKLALRGKRVPERGTFERPVDYLRVPLAWGFTMALVGLAWIYFRAPDFGTAWQFVTGILSLKGPILFSWAAVALKVLPLLLLIDIPQFLSRTHTRILEWPVPVRGLVYAAFLACLIVYSSGNDVPFIYFQF